MLHTKYQRGNQVSKKKNYKIFVLCSYVQLVTPRAGPVLTPRAFYLKIGLRSTRRCYIQNIKALGHPVLEKKNYKLFVLCSYVQLVTPRAGPVLTPGAFYEQTWWRSTRRCHIQNIKSLHLPVSEKKNFEDWLLCSYVPTCDPRGGASFDPRGII